VTFIPDFNSTPTVWGNRRKTSVMFCEEKLEWWCYQKVKKCFRICLAVSIQYTNVTERSGHTDRLHNGIGHTYVSK